MGVVTLAAIESRVRHRKPSLHFLGGGGSDPEDVERAVDWVRAASVGEVLSLAVRAGEDYAGPWNPVAPGEVALLVRVTPGPLGWLSGLLPRHRPPRYDEEAQIRELLAVPGQHAAYPSPPRLVGVDWRAASEHYDAVHLSWAGFLTTEGYVSELADGSVTMLRGFASEHTLWLSDVFAPVPAVPLGAPEGLTGDIDDDRGIDVADNPDRAARDRLNLDVMLGRREVPSPPSPDPTSRKRRRMWRR